jgi:hypothetical protein
VIFRDWWVQCSTQDRFSNEKLRNPNNKKKNESTAISAKWHKILGFNLCCISDSRSNSNSDNDTNDDEDNNIICTYV